MMELRETLYRYNSSMEESVIRLRQTEGEYDRLRNVMKELDMENSRWKHINADIRMKINFALQGTAGKKIV